jgi:voltage-gated potassium channel
MSTYEQRKAEHQGNSLREKLWRVIFLSESGWSKLFDVVLLWFIGLSVLVVMLGTVQSVMVTHAHTLMIFEWVFTILFTIEYGIRIWVVREKRRYIFSFFGIVDLLSILPTFLEFFLAGSGHFIVIRILRLLRMFRILKMVQHMGEATVLVNALRGASSKIAVFLFGVLAVVSIEGTMMYIIEGGQEGTGFTSIPQSIYWGIVTITTVGYGDIAPVTIAGKVLASIIMMSGFAIIAVPTGIAAAEIHRSSLEVSMDRRDCPRCHHRGHDPDAHYCKMCGEGFGSSAKEPAPESEPDPPRA